MARHASLFAKLTEQMESIDVDITEIYSHSFPYLSKVTIYIFYMYTVCILCVYCVYIYIYIYS